MKTDPAPSVALVQITDDSVAAQIHAVLQAAYALEAALISCSLFPPLQETLADLRRSLDTFLVFRQGDYLVGALSFDRCAEAVVISRLGVSPAHLRRGIATALLADFERRLPPMTQLAVSTAQANAPAIQLYEKFGHAVASRSVSAEGIPLVHLSKCVRD
ncbi:MAG: GNAT family N-acetyltransferase [Chthoniobacteraceae bacterium]